MSAEIIIAGCFGIVSAAAAIGSIWATVKCCWDQDWLFAAFFGLFAAPMSIALCVAVFMMVQGDRSPTLETLRKGEWVCVATHQQVITTTVLVGKVMVPQTHVQTVCDTYQRVQS